MSFFIKRLAIVGVGLIGGSLARALKEQDLVGEVVGTSRRAETREKALQLGVVDRVVATPEECVAGATLVVMATPVLSIVPIVRQVAHLFDKGAVVTDVGSVKGSIVGPCEAVMPEGVHFVGGHPIAGRENSGVEASFSTLFQGSRTILTPTPHTDASALELVRLVWASVGSYVETMEVSHHDRVLAATSHLPHLSAYNVVHTLSELSEEMRVEVFRYAASGFRDFTRIASSDPVMWRDICLANPGPIVEILSRFRDNISELIGWIEAGDAAAMEELFSRSKRTRDRVIAENKLLRGGT